MTFSCLSEREVKERYHRATNKQKILPILAALTCSTLEEMKVFLGLQAPKQQAAPSYDRSCKDRMKLYQMGFSDKEIAERIGLTRSGVESWRLRNRLPSNWSLRKGGGRGE